MKEDEDETLRNALLPPEYNYHKKGRRSGCNAELTLTIAMLIARGSTAKDASILSGINPSTYHTWMKRGYDEHERLWELGVENREITEETDLDELPYLIFYYAIQKAIPMRKALYIGRIEKAGRDPRNWTAIAWLLERLHPDEFGRKTKFEVKHIDWRDDIIEGIKNGLDYEIIAEKLGDEETERLYERAGVDLPGTGASGESPENDPENSGTHQE